MSLRRAAPVAAGLWTGRAVALGAGRSAALGAVRSAALGAGRFRHGASLGSAASRSFSTGGVGRLSSYWGASQLWMKNMGKKYEQFSKEYKQANELIQVTIRIGEYLFTFMGVAITGLYYLIDKRVANRVAELTKELDEKVLALCKELDLKVDEVTKGHADFKKVAISDFQEHVSKTQIAHAKVQSHMNELHQKLLNFQEEERNYRHEIWEAAEFLKLKGYIVLSSDDFSHLINKVNEIDERTASYTVNQVAMVPDLTTKTDPPHVDGEKSEVISVPDINTKTDPPQKGETKNTGVDVVPGFATKTDPAHDDNLKSVVPMAPSISDTDRPQNGGTGNDSKVDSLPGKTGPHQKGGTPNS